MKVDFSKRDVRRAVYAFIVIAASILFLLALLNMGAILDAIGKLFSILTPFIVGFVLAYLLNNFVKFFESKVFCIFNRKKKRPKLIRVLSIITSVLIFFGIIVALFYIIIPEIYNSISNLVSNVPKYLEMLDDLTKQIYDKLNIHSDAVEDVLFSWKNLILNASDSIAKLLPGLLDLSVQITSGVTNALIGFIISIYMLMKKELFFAQLKKFLFAILPYNFTLRLIRLSRDSNKVFTGFITGKLLSSLIVGILCYIGMLIFGMPYALLISVIIGVTNIIPFFGPFIGAIPSAIIILLADPMMALWFIIFIIALQQIQGNVIEPRILGEVTGLSAFWVMFALLFFGGLFGVVGLLLGVPTFAVIYSIIRALIENRLAKKGMSRSTKDYLQTEDDIPRKRKEKAKDPQ